VYIDNITVIVTVRVLPSGVAIANNRFTFYNCSALDMYEQIIQSSTSTTRLIDSSNLMDYVWVYLERCGVVVASSV